MLVATYGYLTSLKRVPAFATLTVGILLGKLVYYVLKFCALSSGMLAGGLSSTPLQTQMVLAPGTAAIFGLVDYYRTKAD